MIVTVQPNSNALFSNYWKRKIDDAGATLDWPLAQTGEPDYCVFIPQMGLVIKHLDSSSRRFICEHFSRAGRQHYWLWKLWLAAVSWAPRWFAPATVRIALDGDLVYFGNSIIEYDFARKRVSKLYKEPLAPYLCESLNYIDDTIDHLEGGGVRVSSDLRPGRPLDYRNEASLLEEGFSTALQIIQCRNLPAHHQQVSVGSYAKNLAQTLPEACINPYFSELISSLSKEADNVVLSLSHGDFKPENIIHHRQQFWLIDWEVASMRSELHDVMNIVIHPAVHGIDYPSNSPWTLLERLSYQLLGREVDRSFLITALRLALVEKYCLYMNSGRWDSCLEQTAKDWCDGVDRLKRLLGGTQ
ncbi:hypothetical protein DV711_10575 [Motiliproteus coralliicola]|uniref:Uncharacterized protein n=1 Tax=Motiliproteus coralliicola TaxID=2283196 RepID=A0A369WMN8_9GAMM|nr:hypothetical protein [Motiliproteus coralliicola]RDE22982.1 hypothetical protein DV711_10575 [Motiliproteus coralliicola]